MYRRRQIKSTQIERINNIVGIYAEGIPSIQISYKVKIVDYLDKKTVGIFLVNGSNPCNQKNECNKITGSDPKNFVMVKINEMLYN